MAIFEVCLNESYSASDDFWRDCSRIAKEEFAPGNFFTGGDSYGKHDYTKPIWDVPWTGWVDETFERPALFAGQGGVDREYGDYEFGGEGSTSRADWGDGGAALMLQAWNFIWSHNRNRGNPWSYFDLTWEGIDTRRGFSDAKPISKSGLLDYYRQEKPIAWFFQSQVARQPFVKIANGWSPRPSKTKVVVFSNADEVELVLNGHVVARQRPDRGPTTGYIGPKRADPLYWAHGKGQILPPTDIETPVGGKEGALPFSGTNGEHLLHPPFTFFGVPFEAGKLEARAYRKGKRIGTDTVVTAGPAVALRLRIAEGKRPLEADGADFVFVYAEALDRAGNLVRDFGGEVQIDVQGVAKGIGETRRLAIGGVAPFLVGAAQVKGKYAIRATATGLRSAMATRTAASGSGPTSDTSG